MKLEEIKALSDRELAIALAKAVMGAPDNYDLPEFTGFSLDAIAPLEAKTVEEFGGEQYIRCLGDVWDFDDKPISCASARNRAEACLLAWEGE